MKQESNKNANLSNLNENRMVLRLGNSESFFEVAPNQGGRLVKLVIDNLNIITEPNNLSYSDSYAASILCPFPNRIEDGTYNFNNVDYVLTCNQTKEHNALHGLIYNQTFDVVEQIQHKDKAEVKLVFNSDGSFEGFPFKFKVELIYALFANQFSCQIKVTNTDEYAFPFALGWHPYFSTSDKNKSSLQFKTKNQLISNHRNIPVEVKARPEMVTLNFDESFDDCFELAINEAVFITPDYELILKTDNTSNYLQIYTPPGANVVAVEPMTAPANSFNNGMGLRILEVKATHTETYTLLINNTNS